MPIETTPTQYRTSDGEKYTDEKAAEKHESLIEANKRFEDARHHLGRVLAESQKTADGYPFKFSAITDYWYLKESFWNRPQLFRVSFYLWGVRFDIDKDNALTIHQREGDDDHSYSIGSLYTNKQAAEIAELAAQDEWLAARTAEIEERRKSINT